MRFVLEHTDSFSTQNSWWLARKMPLTTMLVVITQLERKWLILFWTESENWWANLKWLESCWVVFIAWSVADVLDSLSIRLTSAQVCKVSSSSIPLVEVRALVSHLCLWSVCLSTMERNPSWNFQSTQHHKLQQLLLSLTIPFLPLTQPWNTLTVPSWWTMRPSMTSAAATWTLRGQLTPTWTDWLVRLCPPSQLPSVLMVPWMWIWLSFRYLSAYDTEFGTLAALQYSVLFTCHF